MPDGEVTLGELGRRIDALEKRYTDGQKDLSRQITELQFVHRETFEVEQRQTTTRLDAIEERLRFYGRSLFVSFGLPVLVALILAVVLTR